MEETVKTNDNNVKSKDSVFREEVIGKTEKDIFDKVMSLPILRIFYPFYEKNKDILLYIFFGGLTTIISLVSYYVCLKFTPVLIANVISWIFSVTFAFWTNRVWVFHSSSKGIGEILKEAISFFASRGGTLLLEEGILLVFVEILHYKAVVIKIMAQIFVLVGNYLLSKLVVFKNKDMQ